MTENELDGKHNNSRCWGSEGAVKYFQLHMHFHSIANLSLKCMNKLYRHLQLRQAETVFFMTLSTYLGTDKRWAVIGTHPYVLLHHIYNMVL